MLLFIDRVLLFIDRVLLFVEVVLQFLFEVGDLGMKRLGCYHCAYSFIVLVLSSVMSWEARVQESRNCRFVVWTIWFDLVQTWR